jgi:hypothetical protein
MIMKKILFAVISLLLILSAPAIQAAVVFSDNFNTENGGVGALNYGPFTNWTVTGGTVDLIGTGFFDFYPGNGLYVDLDGSTNDPGLLTSSVFSLTAGTYSLGFALGGSTLVGSPTDTVQVDLNFGPYSESFTLLSTAPLTMVTRSIVIGGPTSASISFQNSGSDNMGAIVDNVSLESVPVPEPAGIITLMALGLAGLGMIRRQTSRK